MKYKITLFLLILFVAYAGKAQIKDTVVSPKFVPEAVKAATFKDEPDNFLGKMLYRLTPKRLKYSFEDRNLFTQSSDTLVMTLDTTLTPSYELVKSIHLQQLNQIQGNEKQYTEQQWDVVRNIRYNPPHETKDSLIKTIYGFHPFWMGTAYRSYYFSLLSRVAYFSYNLDEKTGQYKEFPNWETATIVDLAHAQGCKVDISVTCHGAQQTTVFLTNPQAQVVFTSQLIRNLKSKNADGVNLNFEEVPSNMLNHYMTFIKSLSYALKRENPSYFFSVCLPAFDWSKVYMINEIEPYVDLFIVMGYSFSGSFSNQASPNAPLQNQAGNINIPNSISYWTGQGIPKSKIILGVPYYGNKWNTADALIPSNTTSFKGTINYREIANNFRDRYKSYFDSINSSSYMVFKEENNWSQIWYDDENSLTQKYNYVIDRDLAGIAIWALGYDNGFPNLWHLINRKFTVDPELLAAEKRSQQKQALSTLGDKLQVADQSSPVLPGPKSLELKSPQQKDINAFFIVAAIILLILILFGVVGFLISLFDLNVREVLFSDNFRVIIFFVLILILVQIFLRIFDVLDDMDILFIIGILIGVGITTIVIRVSNMNKLNQKDLTP
jgi:spore germination protein YaaH